MESKYCEKGWYVDVPVDGLQQRLEIEEVLHVETTPFQDIMVFKSPHFGKVLVLDGALQLTERDEFAYQELLCNLPICSHLKPKRVLVIGGGDGGILRELARHKDVEEIILCEIDERVIEVSKKYIPSMATGFDDARVTLQIGDGFEYLRSKKNHFDVVIVDSSDPIGPAEVLFSRPFFVAAAESLKEGGVFCNQAESIWLEMPSILQWQKDLKSVFGSVQYASFSIPTYLSGTLGFFLASKSAGVSFEKPVRVLDSQVQDQLKFYDSVSHQAAFMLPLFARRQLGQSVVIN